MLHLSVIKSVISTVCSVLTTLWGAENREVRGQLCAGVVGAESHSPGCDQETPSLRCFA
jgi:hypothetical protein